MTGNIAMGFTCCLVAGIGFGSNYLPVKQVKVGDGVFFSACMAIGILLVGTCVNFTVACSEYSLAPHRPPQFEPMAAIGGAVWMLGNLLVPLIIEWLGLGLGLAVWDCFNLLTGWATGSFGLFGVWKEAMPHPEMNYTGVAMACVSLVLLAFAGDDGEAQAEAKELELGDMESNAPEASKVPEASEAHEATVAAVPASKALECSIQKHLSVCSTRPSTSSLPNDVASISDLESGEPAGNANDVSAVPAEEVVRNSDRKSTLVSFGTAFVSEVGQVLAHEGKWAWAYFLNVQQTRQAAGFLLAIVAGFFFGLTFDLPTDLMQLGKLAGDHSTNPMDYVFSHFCGIAGTGAVALIAYVAVKRGESYTPRSVVMPAIASGAMWGVAQVAWFQANVELSMVVAFPVISTLPGIVGMAWGFFLFGEFRTRRARFLAGAGMCIRIPAVVLIALSGL